MEEARERIQKLLVTGDNRLKQGVDPQKARESWEQALAVAREAGLEEQIRPLVEVRLADLEADIRVVMALLHGETVEAEIEGKHRLIRLLNPELGLINTRDPVGLYLAASGPRARAASAISSSAFFSSSSHA